jgi:hypothetical protein
VEELHVGGCDARCSLQLTTMTEPLITTVIPTFRRPQMLRRAVRSVLYQTVGDFRICIYDNASNDETEAVARELCRVDSRVEYFRRGDNIGAHANFVDGANRVRTPFFHWLPDDDLLLPNFFEAAIQGFEQHPEASLSILATLHVTNSGLIRDAWIMDWDLEGLLMPPKGSLEILRHGNPGLEAILIRREVWHQLGGFDESVKPAEDYDFELRAAALHPIYVSRQPGGIQLNHSGSNTTGVNLHWVWPAMDIIIGKVQQLPILQPEKGEIVNILKRRYLERSLVTRGVLISMKNGDWADADRAIQLIEQQTGGAQARFLRRFVRICKCIPGVQLVLRILFHMRNWGKAARNLRRSWRYRGSIRVLRILSGEQIPLPREMQAHVES